MLLGIDASRCDPALAGVGRYSTEMVRHLVGHRRHRYRLYANGAVRPDWSRLPGVEWRDIPFPRLWTHLRLSAEMLTQPPDLLFVPGHVLPVIHLRRTLVTIHDLGYRRFPECHPPRQRLYLRLSTAWSARVSTMILVDSRATQADLAAAHPVAAAKSTVVYPGVSASFRPQAAEVVEAARRRLGLPDQYLLFVGTIQPRKNLLRLIKAHGQVPEAPSLVIVGRPGWMSAPIMEYIENASHRVQVLDSVADADLPAVYSGATALTFPSLYEGFGIPALEAMACGTAVVASTTSSLPEVVGGAGILVDPLSVDGIAAAIRRIIGEPDLRYELGARGRERSRHFTWPTAARQALEVMEALFDQAS